MREENFGYNDYYFDYRSRIRQRQDETYEREDASKFVQAFINNFSFPTNLDELQYLIGQREGYSIEGLLEDEETNWTVPRWAKPGDIVFFMHAKTAISKITALVTELNKQKDSYTLEDFNVISAWLKRARDLYNAYGGKIMAIGRVAGAPERLDTDDGDDVTMHWSSKLYADIDSVIVLENPVDISEFNSFIQVTRGGAITPVLGDNYEKLRALIGRKNRLPRYVRESVAIPLPLRNINSRNWMEIAGDFRRSFNLEYQFRVYYVDYLLAKLGDRSKFNKECRCCKPINPDSFVDNVIMLNGKYLSVEIKLDIHAEKNIKGQVIKYCDVDQCYLKQGDSNFITSTDMYDSSCLIIDTYKVYMYDAVTDSITELYDLDRLHSKADVAGLRKLVANSVRTPDPAGNRKNRKSTITIQNMDISRMYTDAIVNAANTHLKPGTGVSGAIFSSAGYRRLSAACRKIGNCDVGSAVITPGFSLQAKYIIHTVGPIWKDGKNNEENHLYSAYVESLKLAMENECHSIAFPLLSTGAHGYPSDQAWKTAIQACRDFIEQNKDYRIDIVFVSLDDWMIQQGLVILETSSE